MELKQYAPLAAETLRVARAQVAHDSPATVELTNTTALREARLAEVSVTEAFDGAPNLDVVAADFPWEGVDSGVSGGQDLRGAAGPLMSGGGVVCGAAGAVVRLGPDGAVSATRSITDVTLRAAVDLTGDEVLVAGDTGIAFIVDSDNNPTQVPLGVAVDIYDGTRAADGGLILVGSNGTILRGSADAGTWTLAASGTSHRLRVVLRAPDGTLVAAGDHAIVLRSTDDGQNWSTIDPGTGEWLFGGAVAANGNLILCGGHGEIRLSTDTGLTWSGRNSRTPSDKWLLGGVVTGNGRIVLAGDGGVATRSNNNGETWEAVNIGAGEQMNSGLNLGGGEAVLIGNGGTAVRKPADLVLDSLDAAQLATPGLHQAAVRADVAGAMPEVRYTAGGATEGAAGVELTYRT